MLWWGEVATRGQLLCWWEQAELSPSPWDWYQLTPVPKPTLDSLRDPVLFPMTPHPFSQRPKSGMQGQQEHPQCLCRCAEKPTAHHLPGEHRERGAEWGPHPAAHPRAVSARGRAWKPASISGTAQHLGRASRAVGCSQGWVPLQPPGAGLPPAHSPPGMHCPPKPSHSHPWPQAAPRQGAAGAILLGLQGARQGAEPGVCRRAGGARPPPCTSHVSLQLLPGEGCL